MTRNIFLLLSVSISLISFGQTDILNEDFQLGFPTNWTMVDVDQQIPNAEVSEYTSAWIIKSDPTDLSDSVISSTSYYEPIGQANKWLITPAITLGDYGNYISWNAKSHDPSYPEKYKILISTSNQVPDFQDTVRLIDLENPDWTAREVDLSELGFNGQQVYIAFVNTTNDGFKLYLDDIRVRKNDPVGIQENTQSQLNLYPNPSADYFWIQTDRPINSVSLVALDGKIVTTFNNYKGEKLDISSVQSGIYLVKIDTEGKTETLRLIKK